MQQKELKELLRKEALNQLGEKEKQALHAWYEEFDEKERDLVVFKDQNHEKEIYSRLLQRIYAAVPEPAVLRTKRFSLHVSSWLKIAAVLAIFAGSVPLYFYLNYKASREIGTASALLTTRTASGKMTELTLEDGSVVTLNTATKFSYPKHFSSRTREVYLEGEAFFKVSHDPKKPFIVHSGSLSTRVLGTSFNIRAYKGIDEIKVNVATGKVGIESGSKKLGLLLPDQEMQYHRKNKTYTINYESAVSASLWKQGRIRLDGASFEELAIVLNNTYGYQLDTQNEVLKKITFKISFNNYDPVATVMKMICRIPDSKFRIREKRIIMY